ncbi:hypothetical protein [Hoeflea sp. TYP-13]|uniref:hypothetical protein n=1 Tax=Hoeflea sp. TYP-13 TaxID=3230023 RepID=UPI0034C6CD3F
MAKCGFCNSEDGFRIGDVRDSDVPHFLPVLVCVNCDSVAGLVGITHDELSKQLQSYYSDVSKTAAKRHKLLVASLEKIERTLTKLLSGLS